MKGGDSMLEDSRFYMWRAVFAVAHADREVSQEERQYMAEVVDSLSLSKEQEEVLRRDIIVGQDPIAMFRMVSATQDKNDFFKFAQQMIWKDGDYTPAEKRIMLRLKEMHEQVLDVDDLVGSIPLELEEDKKPLICKPPERPKGWRGFLKELKETLFEED